MITIGIDVGGTSIKGAAVDQSGKIYDVFSIDIIKGESGEDCINRLIDEVENYIKNHTFKEVISGIGLGIPGSIDSTNGIVCSSANLKWENLPVRSMFHKRLPYPIRITNDANAAALGETKFGAGKNYESAVMITLGTGVGGGVIIDGKLFEGNEGKGTELGHMVIDFNGRECGCGRKGCFETYASATALMHDIKEKLKTNPDSMMMEYYDKENDHISGRAAFESAQKGDKAALEVVDQYVDYLCIGLLNICNIFRPNAIILSGGVANAGEFFLNKVRENLKLHYYGYKNTPEVEVKLAEIGYDSGKVGAAALFF